MDTPSLCPAPAELRLDHIVVGPQALTVIAVARQRSAVCSGCGHPSPRVHAWHTRTLTDLPWYGRHVRLAVRK